MTTGQLDIREFHWLMDMLQTIDVGLVVLDREYKIHVWNNFMENHSGFKPEKVRNKNIFSLFKDIPEDWFRHKAESVFLLKNRAFTTWEQRQYLFKFKNYRPITGTEEFMYQNITLIPLASFDGVVNHVCIIIYDVTDTAISKKESKKANKELAKLSRTDRLTQLNNRGYWEECLQHEFARHERNSRLEASLVMFDIDHFKKVNDTYGHQAGDEVIRVVAQCLRDNLRKTDIAGRYGGEEFGVILADTSTEKAKIFCERLREDIAAKVVEHSEQKITFTISLGICGIEQDITSHKDWLEKSDQALYASKEGGRNQTNVFKPKAGSKS